MNNQTHNNIQKTDIRTRWKIPLIVSCIILCIWYLASAILTNEESHRINLGVQLSQETKNVLSQSSLTGIETDTGKRLEILANSGTAWGMSPFGTGKPLEEEKEKAKLKFQKPNTEWKTRTLSGITYVFGEGNPREVALTASGIESFQNQYCNENSSHGLTGYEKGLCDGNTGLATYLSPAVEKHIRSALADPRWYNLATECEKALRFTDSGTYDQAQVDPTVMYYDKIFSPGFLDIDNFINIEPTTGRKKLDTGKSMGIALYMMRSMYTGYRNPTDRVNPYGDCVDRYAGDIVRHLEQAVALYNVPLEAKELEGKFSLDPKKSPVPHF